MLHQSFRQVFVLTDGKLLATGYNTLGLAHGQVGIFETAAYKSISNPTYPLFREIFFAQGRKYSSEPAVMGGFPNEASYKSQLINGTRIVEWRGKKAKRGDYKQIVAIGWDGSNDCKGITVNCNQHKYVTVKITGPMVTQLHSPDGLIKEFLIEGGCCADPLVPVADPSYSTAVKLAADMMADKEFSRFVRATAKHKCNPALTDPAGTVDCESWDLNLTDNGTDADLGKVQAQYPGKVVTRITREGFISTYRIVQLQADATPANYTNAGATYLPNCATCPTGYTYTAGTFVYKVRREDAGDGTALTAVSTAYSIGAAPEFNSRLSYEFGTSTYIIGSTTAIGAASGLDQLEFLGNAADACTLTTPTTTAWVAGPASKKYPKKLCLTLADDACGTDFLPLLTAQYASIGTVALLQDGDCTKAYEITILSDCLEAGCYQQPPVFTHPQSFRGYIWEECPCAVDTTPLDCDSGVFLETIWVNEFPSDLMMEVQNVEYGALYLEVSTYLRDDTQPSGRCTADIPVTYLKNPTFPQGLGAWVRDQEIKSRGYELEYRDEDPYIRAAEGYQLNADVAKFYDEYSLVFYVKRLTGGWGESTEDKWTLSIYVPEGQGKQLEAAVNGYLTSARIDLPPVVL